MHSGQDDFEVLTETDNSDDDGEEKIGFVQHLSATKRWGPVEV